MHEKIQVEVDANFEAFQEVLPDLMSKQANRWALMRHGECIGFYDTLRDAHVAARALYDDGLFSVQQVSYAVVDLGWFSHGVY